MEKFRVQDDLYNYVNHEKLEELVIPDDSPSVGGFKTLSDDVEKLMINEFNTLCESKNYPNEHLERACTLYMAVKDVKKRNRYGIKPALKHLAPIEKLESVKSLNRALKSFVIKRAIRPWSARSLPTKIKKRGPASQSSHPIVPSSIYVCYSIPRSFEHSLSFLYFLRLRLRKFKA